LDADPNFVTLKMKAARFSETSEEAFYLTRGENPKGHHLSNQP
jgi:hypothetical protein